jgi:energy-coupling factor transporter ATP-binding protein EcfA2
VHPLLTIEHLTKAFPGQVALDDVNLTINSGSTHALVGQNGSGKSTLIKVLAGYHQPSGDAATAFMHAHGDRPEMHLQLGDARSADAAGIRFVHQDLGLVDAISSVENLALGGGYDTSFGRIHWKREITASTTSMCVLHSAHSARRKKLPSPSPARCAAGSRGHDCWCSTSRRHRCPAPTCNGCSRRSAGSRSVASRSSTCRTTSKKCSRSLTRSRCCATVATSPRCRSKNSTTSG